MSKEHLPAIWVGHSKLNIGLQRVFVQNIAPNSCIFALFPSFFCG
jgi:hypothetical protein